MSFSKFKKAKSKHHQLLEETFLYLLYLTTAELFCCRGVRVERSIFLKFHPVSSGLKSRLPLEM